MLETAVKAEMPLIQVTTTDVLNVKEVISHLIPNATFISGLENLFKQDVYKVGVALKDLPNINYHVAYDRLLDEGKSVIFVNPTKPIQLAFNAGEVPVPASLVLKTLEGAGYAGREAEKLLPALGNLTIKEIGEVCKFTQVEFGDLTAQGINLIKRRLFSEPQGLVLVDPYQDFYFADKRLEYFLEKEKFFFLECDDNRLVPRGLLLHGEPGVGKSQAAKYFAKQWGIPIYLMDLSSIMGKYVGQSEQGMRSMLSRIDAEAPAILLLDEIEKLFKGDGDSGTTSRLLSQLLWWLAEHRSRVFTMMTSNDIKVLPQELYRPGRIDELIELEGLNLKQSQKFVGDVLAKFEGYAVLKGDLVKRLAKLYAKGQAHLGGKLAQVEKVSHADLVQIVKDEIKKHYNAIKE